ncbi:hypothetical protein BKA62DRAFT_671681 [Auriculariales sp. MPI-PUGE-AT-0066]|nr:hypothetical protein BKA62DRAFT_671681 [Auriculariales sp. MPI-PUGE-AT-0066]
MFEAGACLNKKRSMTPHPGIHLRGVLDNKIPQMLSYWCSPLTPLSDQSSAPALPITAIKTTLLWSQIYKDVNMLLHHSVTTCMTTTTTGSLSIADKKMHMDLGSVTVAINRLYLMALQLQNHRAQEVCANRADIGQPSGCADNHRPYKISKILVTRIGTECRPDRAVADVHMVVLGCSSDIIYKPRDENTNRPSCKPLHKHITPDSGRKARAKPLLSGRSACEANPNLHNSPPDNAETPEPEPACGLASGQRTVGRHDHRALWRWRERGRRGGLDARASEKDETGWWRANALRLGASRETLAKQKRSQASLHDGSKGGSVVSR